jgi:hypothetical protein
MFYNGKTRDQLKLSTKKKATRKGKTKRKKANDKKNTKKKELNDSQNQHPLP